MLLRDSGQQRVLQFLAMKSPILNLPELLPKLMKAVDGFQQGDIRVRCWYLHLLSVAWQWRLQVRMPSLLTLPMSEIHSTCTRPRLMQLETLYCQKELYVPLKDLIDMCADIAETRRGHVDAVPTPAPDAEGSESDMPGNVDAVATPAPGTEGSECDISAEFKSSAPERTAASDEGNAWSISDASQEASHHFIDPLCAAKEELQKIKGMGAFCFLHKLCRSVPSFECHQHLIEWLSKQDQESPNRQALAAQALSGPFRAKLKEFEGSICCTDLAYIWLGIYFLPPRCHPEACPVVLVDAATSARTILPEPLPPRIICLLYDPRKGVPSISVLIVQRFTEGAAPKCMLHLYTDDPADDSNADCPFVASLMKELLSCMAVKKVVEKLMPVTFEGVSEDRLRVFKVVQTVRAFPYMQESSVDCKTKDLDVRVLQKRYDELCHQPYFHRNNKASQLLELIGKLDDLLTASEAGELCTDALTPLLQGLMTSCSEHLWEEKVSQMTSGSVTCRYQVSKWVAREQQELPDLCTLHELHRRLGNNAGEQFELLRQYGVALENVRKVVSIVAEYAIHVADRCGEEQMRRHINELYGDPANILESGAGGLAGVMAWLGKQFGLIRDCVDVSEKEVVVCNDLSIQFENLQRHLDNSLLNLGMPRDFISRYHLDRLLANISIDLSCQARPSEENHESEEGVQDEPRTAKLLAKVSQGLQNLRLLASEIKAHDHPFWHLLREVRDLIVKFEEVENDLKDPKKQSSVDVFNVRLLLSKVSLVSRQQEDYCRKLKFHSPLLQQLSGLDHLSVLPIPEQAWKPDTTAPQDPPRQELLEPIRKLKEYQANAAPHSTSDAVHLKALMSHHMQAETWRIALKRCQSLPQSMEGSHALQYKQELSKFGHMLSDTVAHHFDDVASSEGEADAAPLIAALGRQLIEQRWMCIEKGVKLDLFNNYEMCRRLCDPEGWTRENSKLPELVDVLESMYTQANAMSNVVRVCEDINCSQCCAHYNTACCEVHPFAFRLCDLIAIVLPEYAAYCVEVEGMQSRLEEAIFDSAAPSIMDYDVPDHCLRPDHGGEASKPIAWIDSQKVRILSSLMEFVPKHLRHLEECQRTCQNSSVLSQASALPNQIALSLALQSVASVAMQMALGSVDQHLFGLETGAWDAVRVQLRELVLQHTKEVQLWAAFAGGTEGDCPPPGQTNAQQGEDDFASPVDALRSNLEKIHDIFSKLQNPASELDNRIEKVTEDLKKQAKCSIEHVKHHAPSSAVSPQSEPSWKSLEQMMNVHFATCLSLFHCARACAGQDYARLNQGLEFQGVFKMCKELCDLVNVHSQRVMDVVASKSTGISEQEARQRIEEMLNDPMDKVQYLEWECNKLGPKLVHSGALKALAPGVGKYILRTAVLACRYAQMHFDSYSAFREIESRVAELGDKHAFDSVPTSKVEIQQSLFGLQALCPTMSRSLRRAPVLVAFGYLTNPVILLSNIEATLKTESELVLKLAYVAKAVVDNLAQFANRVTTDQGSVVQFAPDVASSEAETFSRLVQHFVVILQNPWKASLGDPVDLETLDSLRSGVMSFAASLLLRRRGMEKAVQRLVYVVSQYREASLQYALKLRTRSWLGERGGNPQEHMELWRSTPDGKPELDFAVLRPSDVLQPHELKGILSVTHPGGFEAWQSESDLLNPLEITTDTVVHSITGASDIALSVHSGCPDFAVSDLVDSFEGICGLASVVWDQPLEAGPSPAGREYPAWSFVGQVMDLEKGLHKRFLEVLSGRCSSLQDTGNLKDLLGRATSGVCTWEQETKTYLQQLHQRRHTGFFTQEQEVKALWQEFEEKQKLHEKLNKEVSELRSAFDKLCEDLVQSCTEVLSEKPESPVVDKWYEVQESMKVAYPRIPWMNLHAKFDARPVRMRVSVLDPAGCMLLYGRQSPTLNRAEIVITDPLQPLRIQGPAGWFGWVSGFVKDVNLRDLMQHKVIELQVTRRQRCLVQVDSISYLWSPRMRRPTNPSSEVVPDAEMKPALPVAHKIHSMLDQLRMHVPNLHSKLVQQANYGAPPRPHFYDLASWLRYRDQQAEEAFKKDQRQAQGSPFTSFLHEQKEFISDLDHMFAALHQNLATAVEAGRSIEENLTKIGSVLAEGREGFNRIKTVADLCRKHDVTRVKPVDAGVIQEFGGHWSREMRDAWGRVGRLHTEVVPHTDPLVIGCVEGMQWCILATLLLAVEDRDVRRVQKEWPAFRESLHRWTSAVSTNSVHVNWQKARLQLNDFCDQVQHMLKHKRRRLDEITKICRVREQADKCAEDEQLLISHDVFEAVEVVADLHLLLYEEGGALRSKLSPASIDFGVQIPGHRLRKTLHVRNTTKSLQKLTVGAEQPLGLFSLVPEYILVPADGTDTFEIYVNLEDVDAQEVAGPQRQSFHLEIAGAPDKILVEPQVCVQQMNVSFSRRTLHFGALSADTSAEHKAVLTATNHTGAALPIKAMVTARCKSYLCVRPHTGCIPPFGSLTITVALRPSKVPEDIDEELLVGVHSSQFSATFGVKAKILRPRLLLQDVSGNHIPEDSNIVLEPAWHGFQTHRWVVLRNAGEVRSSFRFAVDKEGDDFFTVSPAKGALEVGEETRVRVAFKCVRKMGLLRSECRLRTDLGIETFFLQVLCGTIEPVMRERHVTFSLPLKEKDDQRRFEERRTVETSFTVRNRGTLTYHAQVEDTPDILRVKPQQFDVPPGSNCEVSVQWRARTFGTLPPEVVVRNRYAPDWHTLQCPLRAVIEQPTVDISVEYLYFGVMLHRDGSEEETEHPASECRALTLTATSRAVPRYCVQYEAKEDSVVGVRIGRQVGERKGDIAITYFQPQTEEPKPQDKGKDKRKARDDGIAFGDTIAFEKGARKEVLRFEVTPQKPGHFREEVVICTNQFTGLDGQNRLQPREFMVRLEGFVSQEVPKQLPCKQTKLRPEVDWGTAATSSIVPSPHGTAYAVLADDTSDDGGLATEDVASLRDKLKGGRQYAYDAFAQLTCIEPEHAVECCGRLLGETLSALPDSGVKDQDMKKDFVVCVKRLAELVSGRERGRSPSMPELLGRVEKVMLPQSFVGEAAKFLQDLLLDILDGSFTKFASMKSGILRDQYCILSALAGICICAVEL